MGRSGLGPASGCIDAQGDSGGASDRPHDRGRCAFVACLEQNGIEVLCLVSGTEWIAAKRSPREAQLDHTSPRSTQQSDMRIDARDDLAVTTSGFEVLMDGSADHLIRGPHLRTRNIVSCSSISLVRSARCASPHVRERGERANRMAHRFHWSKHQVIIIIGLAVVLAVLWAFASDFKG